MSDTAKPGLLFLCHRLPYPPNKGDKIRSWHLLKFLARHHRVYLGTFIDDSEDWQYVNEVQTQCAELKVLSLEGLAPKLRGIVGLLTGRSLSEPWYHLGDMKNWVDALVEQQKVTHALAFSSPMAQYILPHKSLAEHGVIDMVDIDSDKWAQYAAKKPWPLSVLYRTEARRLFRCEEKITRGLNYSLFVSSTEAAHFRQMLPGLSDKIGYYNNGVDTEYFAPAEFVSPFAQDSVPVLVFTGAMDYWPNVDAVRYFCREVLPALQQRGAVSFCIVGSKPGKEVQSLAQLPGVTVTGRVPDVRPYLAHAAAVIAPMRVARGVQNKVLEGLAMDKPVVTTSLGLEGISAVPGKEVLIADSPEAWLDCLSFIFGGDSGIARGAARKRVLSDFNWNETLPVVLRALNGESLNG